MTLALSEFWNGGLYLISDTQISRKIESPDWNRLNETPNHYQSDYWEEIGHAPKTLFLSESIVAQWAGSGFIALSATQKLVKEIYNGSTSLERLWRILKKYKREDIQYIVYLVKDQKVGWAGVNTEQIATKYGCANVIGSGAEGATQILLRHDEAVSCAYRFLNVLARLNHYHMNYVDFYRDLVGGCFELIVLDGGRWMRASYSYWDHRILTGKTQSFGGPRIVGYNDEFLYVADVLGLDRPSRSRIVPCSPGAVQREPKLPLDMAPMFIIDTYSAPTPSDPGSEYPLLCYAVMADENVHMRCGFRNADPPTLQFSHQYRRDLEENAKDARSRLSTWSTQ